MEIECDLASIRDEDLLRKMWQQSEDFGRKKEIRSHLYKLRESRLREFYSTGGPAGGEIMNPATDMHFGKTPLTPSHGDSLVDQSFQSLKSKEIRDSLSPTHEIKFRNSGGVAGGVLVPDTTGWDVQTSSEVSPDGRAFRTESLAKTDGVEKIPGGHAEFAGRNEQKSSASHQGDDKNYVKKAAESSKTHLQEKVVIGDENSGRTEMKSSSVTSSSKVISSSSQQVFSSEDPGFDMQPRRLTNHQDQHYQNVLQNANNNSSSTVHSERQQFSRNERNERQETSSNTLEESKKYVDMDKASPEYQQHVQYLMSQPGAIVSNTVEYPKPGVKMITTVKKLPDGTTVKTKRYETEASAAAADTTSISQTMKQQQKISSNTTTSQKLTEKRIADSEDVFTRLSRTRDANVPASPRHAPETPSQEDVYSRLQQSRDTNEQKFSDSIDQRSTQILRDTNQHPGSRNAPTRRPSDLVENVEVISKTNKTIKKDLNQSVRSEKITSSDFIQNERDRYVRDHESPSRRGPDGYPEVLAPITPTRHGRPQPDDYPTNGYNATEVIKQSSSSKSSAKFSESRRFSTETVESYHENENQDYNTRGYPSNRRPIDEPKGQSPSGGRPGPDYSTHGFPSVRSDKPTQQHPSDKPRAPDEHNTTEKVHIIHTDRNDTTRSNYTTNETRRNVTSTNEDYSTHGFPSVRAGTPTRDSPRRPLGSEPSPGDSPRRPSGQEPPAHQARRPPTDGYSTHGFPSVKNGSPTEDSPRRPSGAEPTSQGRRPTTEDFSTHGFPSVKPGRSTPTQSAPQYESSPRVDREDTVSVTSDRSNSITYEKKIDAAHQAFARSLRCASPVESVRRDSTSDRHTPRSSIGSIRNSYSPSKRDGRSPSHDSVTNSESSRISSATVTKTHRPTEVRRLSSPKSPIGKSSPSHVSNETIDLTLTRKITARPSPDKAAGKPTTIKEEQPVIVEPILRKKIFGATEDFLASEGVIEKPINKNQYYQLGLSDATLPSSRLASKLLGATPNTSRRAHHNTEEELDTLIDTATKHTTPHPQKSPVTPTTRSTKNKEPKTVQVQPETIYSKKPLTAKPEGYITLSEASEITEKHNQTTDKHVSYPHYIPSAPKADRSPSDRPTTNNLSSPAPTSTTTTSTTPHNAPKSTKDNKVKSPSNTTTPKPLSSPSKVDNSTTSRFTKTVKVENAINRDTTTKTRRQPDQEPESELDTEPLAEPEDLDEGYVPDRKGKRKPSSQRPTSDDEGFEPDSPRAGSPTSDFEYRRPEQVRETYDEEDSIVKKTKRTDKKVVTNDFLNTERNVTRTRKTQDTPSHPVDEEPKRPAQDGRKPSYSVDKPTEPYDDEEPKRPQRRPKEDITDQTPLTKDRKPSQLVDEPRKTKGPENEPGYPDEDNRRPSYGKEPSRPDDESTRPSEPSRPRGTKPPLERSETFEERCRQILGMNSETVIDQTNKTQEFIETERTTVDSKHKPSDRSPSPKKRQPSDTVSIEDCEDDDDDQSYPSKTTKTTTTVKTTREYPRDRSPNKKEPTSRPKEDNTGDRPRDRSPLGKLPKGPKTNEYDETTTTVTTTKITDDRSPSPNRKSPKEGKPTYEDNIRPRGRSPTAKVDETTTSRKTNKVVDEIDEKTTRSKPGSRPRDQSPQETRPGDKSPGFGRSPSPKKKQPSDTVSIEDCDDDSDTPSKYTTSKTKTTTTTVKTTRDEPRDKSPSPERRPNRKSPKEVRPSETDDDYHPRDRSPSEKPERVNETTSIHKTTEIVDEIDRETTRSGPGSRPRDQSPQERRPRGESPTNDRLPKDRSPSETRTFITTRETTFDVDTTTRGKSPMKQPTREESPSQRSPRDKSPSKKPTGDYPRDRSPTGKPVRETSTTGETPRGKSPLKKPIRGSTPTEEYPRDRSPTRKPVTDETVIISTTTTHSNVTDGVIEDRYPSYTPKSYPRDRSPIDKQKPQPHHITEEEDVTIQTSKKTKKISTEEIHDDVFEVKRPRERQPDTRDGSYISIPRDQSPTEPSSRPRTNETPQDRSPEKPTTKETNETVTKKTTKKTSDTTVQSEFPDKSPVSRPKDSPRDRSPNKKPTTEETEEYRTTTTTRRDTTIDKKLPQRTHPNDYPNDLYPVDDLTRPRTKGVSETHRVDKKTVINEFLDTERGVVERPQRPKDNKPFDNRSPDRLTSSHPVTKESPTSKPKGPMRTSIDESTTIKSTKTTKDTRIENEVEEVFPTTRPRDRSPTEKPLRSPKIVTTETTTEYGIRSRPRSRSPSEEPEKPSDTEEIDETYVQKTSKKTEKKTITSDLDVDVVKPSRRPRPTGTEDQPREKSPQKSKPSDRSPSPRSKYPKDQGPRPVDNRPQSKSPVGKQPRQSSPAEKSRIYKSTDEETNVVKKSKTTKVTTTSTDVEDVEFENRPRGRSPSEKPRPTGTNQSPRDQPRRSSPTKVPRDREPVDTDYEEVVKRTNKTTRNETTLEERIDRSPIRNYPEDKPREKSPLSKNRGPRPIEETEDRFPKSPRGTSPSEKPTSRDYPRDRSPTGKPGSRDYPRDRSPSDKPKKPSTTERTTTESTTTAERLSKSPRGTSPTGKPIPRDYPRDRSPTDKSRKPGLFDETVIVETTSESTTTKDRFSKSPRHSSPSEKPGPRDYPRDRSPTEKPRKSVPNQETSPTRKPVGQQPRPVGETVVQRTVKTTTVEDRTTKSPRGSSPTKTSPRERSPTQKQPTKDSPRRTSPSEKPSRRQPVVSEVEKTVRKTTSKFNKDKIISEKIIVQDHPRRKSPSEKPRRRPTSDDETDEDDETTETVIAVYTIDGETVKNHPRDLSPSGRPKQPREYSPKRPQTNGDSHRPTDEETEETFVSTKTRLTKESKTFDIEDEDHSPRKTYPGEKPKITRDQPRETSPSGKPRTRQPTDESIDITVVKKTSRTQKGETTVEETNYRSPKDHPRDRSPSGKPSSVRSYPRDSSPKKPIDEDIDDETIVVKSYRKIPFDDDKSPLQKPNGPQTTEETVLYTTKITSQIEDYPRDRSPSAKPGTRSYPRDRSPTEKPGTKAYPGDKSPSEKSTRPRPSKLEETTNRSTTVQRKVQETDFEKRYPKGRPGDQSPSEKPSTLRRPSKLSTTTTTTTTTRNRSTLDEQDINRTQRPRTQPSTRDKIPTKTTPLSSPRSQPTTERRVPADLPSPVRKPKSTFGVTTKTTTVTSRLTGPTRPKPTTESPKKPSKLPVESRPSSRPTERKHSPSISPDSSPSRPGSDVEVDSPYRSPNMSPSRKSPSPTRSVKLEDITETVSTTRKTTVSIAKSKPKVTHVTTAKFQVTPPTSPTKVTSSPEKFSPSSKKPSSKVPTSKSNGSKFTSDTTTTKKVTSKVYKEVPVPTDSERDSEVPTDAEEVDTSFPQKPSSRKLPVTERKESAPVHRVTKVNKDVQMSRSTSENIIKTPINRRPVRNEPLETQRESPRPINGDRSSPKTERRPSKHLSTKTINLTTFDKVINSEDMENVVIDIQHAKSSREPSPNKIVPTPVSVDIYTGKPRYPDVVQEPEDEPKRKPNVKNIPIFEEETNDFVGCQITEVNEETNENTVRARTTKFIEKESIPRRQTPKIITGDNVDSECLLSVHDKVSKFISTAEEVSKPKTSAPFRRDIPEKDMPEDDDECLLTVDEKVSKFLKTADSVTKEVITSKPRRVERPSIEDLDEDLKTDECVLSVSEKVNKFTTKAEKLAPSAPQRSPELVARIERQISRPSDVEESESPEDSPVSVRKFKPTSPLTERTEKKYTERQIDILSRPSVWEKKPKPDVKLDDIIGFTTEEEPRREGSPKTYPEDEKSKPVKSIDSVSKRKELFENKVSTNKTTTTTIKQSSPEKRPRRPAKSPSERHPSDDSDSRYPNEFIPQYVDGYAHQEPDDDVHKDVYGSSKTRNIYEVSHQETVQRSTERSPTRKSSHPENRPTTQYTTKSPRQPEDKTPSRRYSEDHSPRYPTRDQPLSDRYTETRESSDHTTRRRSSTQEYPERRTPYNGSPSPRRNQQPVEEPEDYTFSSRRDENTTHHTTRTAPRSPKDSPLNETSFLDDDERDLSPARSTSTVSSHKQVTTHRSTSKRVTEDISSRRPRRPSGNEPSTPTPSGRTPRGRAVPETVAARRNIFEKSPGDISPMPTNRRPSYMEPTKSSLEHRKDSLEITKTNYSRKSSVDEEPYEPSPRTSVKFGVGLKHKEEPKPKRKLSSSDIPNIEDVYELDLLEEMLNIVTLYEQRRRIRAQIRVVKKLLETKTREEVSRMTKISTIRKTSSSSVRESPLPTPKRETPVRSEKYHPLTDDEIDSESIIESRHIEEHEEIIRERSISPKTKTSRIVTKVTEVRKIGEPTTQTTTTTTTNKRTPLKKDEPKDSKPIWATKNILKKPSDNEKVTRALSAKKTTSTSSSSMSRTQQTHRQRVATDDDCVTSSYGIGPTDEDGRPLFGIRALKKKTTTNTNNTVQPSETTKVTGTVITEKYYSENGAEPVGERKVTVYSTNPEDLVDMETQYDRRDSETVKREKLSKDGLTTVTKVQKIGKYKPGEIPSLTDDAEFTKATSKMVRRGSVKEMSEKFIRKESSSSVTEKSSGYPKAGLILRTRTNSGATADAADQYEVRAKSTEFDYDSEDDVEIRSSRKHSKVVTESEDETSEVRRKINTRSFLNSGGSKVTGVDDVLDRMRNADNVVVDGDTMEDREARSLLNKFLGASVLMSGMESMIPQMELRKSTAGADNKQEVKTTRVTKTIKSGTTGGSSSSPVARETCDFEEIWDEEILKQLLEKSTSYEERRSIRARLRQLMAEREACAELKASAKAELNETKVKTSTIDAEAEDESSGSEYEEIIEEYTASEDDDEDEETTTTTTTVIADKQQKDEVKEEKSAKQITEGIKKTTITKKEEPKSVESKKTVVVETTTVVIEEDDDSSASHSKEKKLSAKSSKEEETNIVAKENDNDGDSDSVSDSKGESLLIPLLQGLLHKNMPQARSSSGSSSKTATNSATTSNQNRNNLKSSLKANNTHFSSTSKSNNNNSLGDSGLSSEVSKDSSLGLQNKNGSSLRVAAPQQIEDSGTESGEDLRLIAAGIRDSMQIEGIENHSDMSLIKEVTNALNKLESSLKEGKDLALDSSKKSTLLALVERLQTGLTAPDKLSNAVGEQDFPDETSSPEADNHRSNRQRFAKRKNRNNRHTVGVSKEELADARRYMEEMVMIENLSNCTTPECNSVTTPPELFAIQKQHSTGAILTSHEPQESSAGLFRPNQFVPNNLKHSTEAGSGHPEVQMRQKKGTPGPGQRQSTGDMDTMKVPNSNNGKRPLSDSFDAYTAQNNRVTFNDPNSQNDHSVEEKNEYNRSHHSDDKQNNHGRLSPDSNRLNRFNNKKQLMKRANTIDIPKTHRYNPEFDTDSDFEERSALHTKGLRGTLQVTVKRKPRQVVPNFEPKTENDHKFLAFIQKQNTTTGVGWNSSKSVSNWTNKFGNIKNVFEAGANTVSSNKPKVSGQTSSSSAKSFWKKSEEQNPPKTSTSVLTSALKAKERNEKRSEVIVPKPIHLNQFSHNPQSAFRPVDTSPETIQMQFKPIPTEKPSNAAINSLSPTKSYNPNPVRRQALESPHYAQSSPTKSWIKKNTATNSPVSLPWTAKLPENNVLKIAATKFESQSPVQRHQSFKQQEKRPSLPNTSYPYQYQDYGHSQSSYVSNSQPTSYAEYPPQPRIYRESSLTNPQAEPLVLTSNAPAYSPHSLQPFDYYADDLNQNAHQTDMTDDDIDDMESMTEYRVEAKVMGKPMSQQAVTVGKRTNHMSDDEVFGKNSKAAKNLLSVMKNIGNGKPDRSAKKPEKKQPPASCISPNGSAYQAPIVEPLFPEVTKFEANRDPEYIGKQKNKQQAGNYHQNPVYVPLEDYQHNEPPVAPPRGRKVSQETKKGSAYVPKERSNVYQSPRRDAPSSLPIQAGPTSPPRYMYSSPIQSPVSSSTTSQILSDGMYMQNVPAFRKPYSEPNTPSDYSASNDQYFNQYGHMQKSYPATQPPVILPQIPLETSYTKVYDQPRDVSSFYQPPLENPNSSAYIQSSPKVQQSSQPSKYIPPEYQQKPEIPQQYYQPSSKVQQSPMPQEYAPQQAYQPRSEISPDYYSSPKVQQSPQQFIPQQVYQPRAEAPQEYYQALRTQQIPQAQAPVQYYQPPKTQPSPLPQSITPQYTDTPAQYEHSPRVPQSSRSDVPQSYYQSPKTQQSPQHSSSEIPLQYSQSPRTPQSQSSVTQQGFKYPQPPQSQTYQPSKNQQSPQPRPIYQPKAPMIQAKPQVSPKNDSVIQSSKFQHSSSTYQQQSIQNVVIPKRPVEQQAPNAAVLCKQASLEGRNRVQSQSQKYEQVEETRRKSLGNVLEVSRIEREAREQKAAAIKQDMYSVQQDVYSQQKSSSKKTEVHQQETKVMYKSSAPDDTPDIVKSSLKKDDIPILKKFGPPQRHCYMPNAYQNPLMKSETSAVLNNAPKTVSRKFSDPAVSRGPLIVEIPSTPQPDSQDEIPRNIVFNKISAFTSMSRKQTEASTEYTSQQNRPNKLSKCDSWHQICQLQNVPKPPSPRFNQHGNAAIRRSKSNHTLALPKLYEASYDRAEISEKQRTVAAYFTGQKSPNSLSRNSSQTNLADECNYVSVKKSSINRIKTSEKASISRQDPSSGLSRSHTMPQIANVNLLDESNVEDAFEQLMNGQSTTTTEKTETKKEDGGVVTTTTKVTTRTISGAPKPVSPFAKFQQLDKQNSLQSPKSPLTPTTPGGSSTTPIFRFTDPALNARAATFKEQLLQWCQSKTQEYENVQITNFSASWTDGLAFCALIHHFLPDAFDYSKLNPKQRRYNFELAFRVADEKAGIAPLLDVEDMVVMKRPDWKCVFTYVQSIYRRFRNCQ